MYIEKNKYRDLQHAVRTDMQLSLIMLPPQRVQANHNG